MTGQVNDHKLAALQTLLSISGGNIDDLEAAWLISEASTFNNINNMWMELFLANGAVSQNYSDAAYEFLGVMGYTAGDISQRWHDYWLAGGGIGGFSPTDIAGLELWYDQSDISTLWQDAARTTAVTTAGDPVGAWDDKSGNGGYALQGTAASKPTYQTVGLSFDGGDWLDNVLYLPAERPLTIFAVFQTVTSASGTILGIVDSASADKYSRILMRGSFVMAQSFRTNVEVFASSASAYNDGTNHVATGMEAATNSRTVWVDGGDSGSDTSTQTVFTEDTISIGRLSDFTPASYWNGYLMELAVYDSALGTTDREAFENYAIARWGI